MKKRYWLFAGYSHYPAGGMRDFIDSFSSVSGAVKWFSEYNSGEDMEGLEFDWYEVFDSERMKISVSAGATCYDKYRNEGLK